MRSIWLKAFEHALSDRWRSTVQETVGLMRHWHLMRGFESRVTVFNGLNDLHGWSGANRSSRFPGREKSKFI
jgi:hypothetical protein